MLHWKTDNPPGNVYNYKCELCAHSLLDPHQTSCGHRMCGACLRQLIKTSGDFAPCPFRESDCGRLSLKQPNPTVRQDYPLLRELKRKLVACTYKEYGCNKLSKGDELQKHEDTCEFSWVQCEQFPKGCLQRIRRGEEEKHSVECKYIEEYCHSCGLSNITKINMQGHIAMDCPETEISCVNKCNGSKILRKNLDDHLKICPMRPQQCLYTAYGCTFQGTEAEVMEHAKTSHVETIAAYLQAERTDLSAKLRDQEMNFNLSVNRANALEERFRIIEQTCAQNTDKIQQQQETITKQRQIIMNFEKGKSQLEKLNSKMAALDQTVSTLQPEMETFRQEVGASSNKLTQFDIRFQLLETSSYDGTLQWKITDYTSRKEAAQSGHARSLYSQPFYTSRHGYRMCARIYLDGDGIGAGTHMSLFFVVMRGQYDALLVWPFRQKVSLMLLRQGSSHGQNIVDVFRANPFSSSFQRPGSEMNVASGCPLFVSQAILEAKDSVFLQQDTIFIKVVVHL